MTLLLANGTYRGIFEKYDQSDAQVKPTPLFYVCTEVYGNFKTKYAHYTVGDQMKFDADFKQLGARIAFLSPSLTGYGGGGQCPQGLELHDLLK